MNQKSKLQSLFEKKFSFINKNYKLPADSSVLFKKTNYKFQKLQEIKDELNDVKNKLNEYPLEKWSVHTRKRNPAGEVTWRVSLIEKLVLKSIFILFFCRLKTKFKQNLLRRHGVSSGSV